jgi:hypothetical protein
MIVLFKIFQITSEAGLFSHFSITKLIALPTAKRKEGKNEIGWCKPVPVGMKQGRKSSSSIARCIYDNHETDSETPKNIQRQKPLVVCRHGKGLRLSIYRNYVTRRLRWFKLRIEY